MHEIDSQHAERFPLLGHVAVPELDVQEDVARRCTVLPLKANPDPAMLFVVALEVPRRNGVPKAKKRAWGPRAARSRPSSGWNSRSSIDSNRSRET
jgi:hypothetical protein